MRLGKRLVGAAVGLALVGAVTSAKAEVVYNFDCITNNNATNAATGEAQLRMVVSNGGVSNGTQYALFKFVNDGPLASSICDVYFDDGLVPSITSISIFADSGAGVDFAVDSAGNKVAPGNLPGGNGIDFKTTQIGGKKGVGLSADSNSPTQPNGVNPGEWMTIKAALYSGMTMWKLYEQLDPRVGELRVGIHVQGFGDGGSESFVAVQSPSAAAGGLALLGLLGLVGYRRYAADRA